MPAQAPNFDVSSAAGQKRLLALSMGHDSEAFLPRPLRGAQAESPAFPPPPAKPAQHPLLGRLVSATWKPGHRSLESTFVGQVVDAVPVSGLGGRFRLVLLLDAAAQITLRCYTDDADWRLADAAA